MKTSKVVSISYSRAVGKPLVFFALLNLAAPVRAFLFAEKIVTIFSGSHIKRTFVLGSLFFSALIAVKVIALVLGTENKSADLAFPEDQPPVEPPATEINRMETETDEGWYPYFYQQLRMEKDSYFQAKRSKI